MLPRSQRLKGRTGRLDNNDYEGRPSTFSTPVTESGCSQVMKDEVRWENAGTEIVKLIVGRKRKEFSIHKNFICQASEAMKAAFCGEFEEGRSGVITLAEDDPLVVQTFIAYCYPNFNGETLRKLEVVDLIGLYIFADKYRCINRLKNLVMDSIQDKMLVEDFTFNAEGLERIFNNTTSSHEAPIRLYAAALVAYTLHISPDDSWVSYVHHVLLDTPDLQIEYLSTSVRSL
ncbi:hypothetical protein ONS95_003330 [Cadophora gregata]|uniref:uncharacterized protein n=1 Tax=Cadophora gregata TaxID=51156 RepID=UPI0026DBB8C6|nr:uncharacterized protein ONS95_003330 [Cadophora gregata]KAK0108525.1 hypothetical protein ONS95_003330 [Cadophora gregata]KAK0108879.1 hypothetical protein ONS96_002716 [Cadophora gregata f. sp. sojae]